MKPLKSQAALQIQKPIHKVYDGIVNPDHMTKYFISESTGPIETGAELLWKFPEFDERFPITNIITELNKSVSFVWDPDTVVTIILEELADKSTVVKVTEGNREYSEQNMEWLISNTAGWANFLACLKAHLEYGISLRKGAYEFMKNGQ